MQKKSKADRTARIRLGRQNRTQHAPVSDDPMVEVLDKALNAAEEHLQTRIRAQYVTPSNLAESFIEFCERHLQPELGNIRSHGHRNDDAADVPPGPRRSTVHVVVEGGVATMTSKSKGVRVVIRDYDVTDHYGDELKHDKNGDGFVEQVFE